VRRTSQIVHRLVQTLSYFSQCTLGRVETNVHIYDKIGSDIGDDGLTAFYTPTGNEHVPADHFAISLSSIKNMLRGVDNRTGDVYLLAIAIHETRHRLQVHSKVEMLNPSFLLPKRISREVWRAVRIYPSSEIPYELDAFTLQKLFQLIAHFGPKRGYRDLECIGADMLTMTARELKQFAEVK
jgi:hypothetical protein